MAQVYTKCTLKKLKEQIYFEIVIFLILKKYFFLLIIITLLLSLLMILNIVIIFNFNLKRKCESFKLKQRNCNRLTIRFP